MAPSFPPIPAPRPSSLGLGLLSLILVVAVLLFRMGYVRWRRAQVLETEPLLEKSSISSLYPSQTIAFPPPQHGAVLLNSAHPILPETRRHSYPLSQSAMAAEKAASMKATVAHVIADYPREAGMDEKSAMQGLLSRKETIQWFAGTQGEAPGKKGVWRRRTLEWEKSM